LDNTGRESEIPRNFCSVVLEKNAEETFDRSIEKLSEEERNILHKIKIRKANLIGNILYRNYLLNHVSKEK
jgi:hypothetical protein